MAALDTYIEDLHAVWFKRLPHPLANARRAIAAARARSSDTQRVQHTQRRCCLMMHEGASQLLFLMMHHCTAEGMCGRGSLALVMSRNLPTLCCVRSHCAPARIWLSIHHGCPYFVCAAPGVLGYVPLSRCIACLVLTCACCSRCRCRSACAAAPVDEPR